MRRFVLTNASRAKKRCVREGSAVGANCRLRSGKNVMICKSGVKERMTDGTQVSEPVEQMALGGSTQLYHTSHK